MKDGKKMNRKALILQCSCSNIFARAGVAPYPGGKTCVLHDPRNCAGQTLVLRRVNHARLVKG